MKVSVLLLAALGVASAHKLKNRVINVTDDDIDQDLVNKIRIDSHGLAELEELEKQKWKEEAARDKVPSEEQIKQIVDLEEQRINQVEMKKKAEAFKA